MEKNNCDLCGAQVNASVFNTYTTQKGKKVLFCNKCWANFSDMRFSNKKNKAQAREYIENMISEGKATALGKECVIEQEPELAEIAGIYPDASPAESAGLKESTASSQYINSANILFILGIIWIIISIILFSNSEVKLDWEAAKYLGVNSVVNFQGTIFATVAFIVGALNIIGGVIIKEIEKLKK